MRSLSVEIFNNNNKRKQSRKNQMKENQKQHFSNYPKLQIKTLQIKDFKVTFRGLYQTKFLVINYS